MRHQRPRSPLSRALPGSHSSSTAALCNSLWDAYNDTHDPDVAATESQIRDDAAWHPDSSARSQSSLSNLCDARTLDTLTQQVTYGDQISLELHHARAWLAGGPNSPLFDWDADLTPSPPNRACDRAAVWPCAGDRRERGGPRLLRSRPGSRPPRSEGEGWSAATSPGHRRPSTTGPASTCRRLDSPWKDMAMKHGISRSPPVSALQLGQARRRPRLRTLPTMTCPTL